MLRIITYDQPPSEAGSNEPSQDGSEEYEIVLGRRQMASLALAGLVLIAVCSGAAYLAGKASVAPPEPAKPVAAVPAVAPAPAVVTIPPDVAKLATANRVAPPTDDSGLYDEPIPGARYIQVGAVDRGVAVILAEGLRSRGFNGFIATGPNANVFRVMVGPLRTDADYHAAKDAVDRMGVNTFTKTVEK